MNWGRTDGLTDGLTDGQTKLDLEVGAPPKKGCDNLSNTTKHTLLDSLLQEVTMVGDIQIVTCLI